VIKTVGAHGVPVTIGDDTAWTFTAALVEAERWNGWACPWFTEPEGRKVAAVTQADYDGEPDATQEFVAVREGEAPGRRFWLVIPQENEARPVESTNLDGVWLYAIGAGNWAWEEAGR
jgi:hypothetical protein